MKKNLTDDQMRELTGYLTEARDRHIKAVSSPLPGFAARAFDREVEVKLWGLRVLEGVHFLKLPPEGTLADGLPEECTWVWDMAPDEESMRASLQAAQEEAARRGEELEENGHVDMEGQSITFYVIPIRLKAAGDRPLSFFELTGWLAIQDAAEQGDEEKAQRIFSLLYVNTKDDKTPELPTQDTIKPHRQYDPNSKLANKMMEPALFNPAGALLDVAGASEKRRGKERDTAVTLSTDDGMELSRPISAFDREVHGAVSTLWVSGNRYVTSRQVAQAMGIRNPTKNQTQRVQESIELQRRVMGRIDYRQEARGRRLYFEREEVTSYTLEGHLINADRVENLKTSNGRVVNGYYLYRAPLIYQHAATLEQIVNYPQRLLGLGKGSDTESNLILKRQLLRQVGRAKEGGQKSIRFTPDENHPDRPCLFTRAGVNLEDWDKRKAATQYALSILDGLVEEGEIKDYEVNRRKVRGGNPVYGVTIKL